MYEIMERFGAPLGDFGSDYKRSVVNISEREAREYAYKRYAETNRTVMVFRVGQQSGFRALTLVCEFIGSLDSSLRA